MGDEKKSYRRYSMLLVVPVLAAAIGIGVVIGAGGPKAEVQAAAADGGVERGLITVSGNGELQVAPDVAYINVGIETRAATAKEAQAKNANQFAAMEKVLYDTYKMAKKDVKTVGFYVQPEYKYNEKDGTSKVTGYVATHTVQITSRNLEGIGQLLDSLSAAGANRIEGVTFNTEKQEQYELQALEKAMANAKAKAETLAKAAGRSVKGVAAISQGNVSSTPIFQRNMNMAAESKADGGATSVQTGEITITTTVSVAYEMQ
ncbi:SIMPL domain-containing protein [Paenibacillus mendelii]|uniref:SIMPL domain-containing protein n=1 Tax=Paenibacillus mendelii TaxID=206163 RepID=A0ABV6JLF3_9BACL|nr:SIMPL domain-containing protein [Paenibacillus mendelii]MCQ6562234.1 SIMPL domain-containing protein [Paenibacillus mendelii]